jgi:hypothetical protein
MSCPLMPWRRFFGLALVAGLAVAVVCPAHAVKLEASEDVYVNVRFLVQPWVQLDNDPLTDPALETNFYLRRTRLILLGQVSPYVSFFMETDQPNWGKDGDWSPELFIQDAFVSFDLHEAFHVATGLLLIPFVHQTRQGATSLHTLDYHSALVRYPAGSHLVWRDPGVEIRGLVANKHLDYKVAITEGVPGTEHDVPRFSGRLQANLFDAEEKFFYGGTYLGKKKILSAGVAFDVQPEAFGDDPYYAFGGDIFLDMPVGDRNRISGQLDVVYYGGVGNPMAGFGTMFDFGVGIGKIEPIIALDWFMPRGASTFTDHYFGPHAGVNWWIKGHNVNIKFDFGLIKAEGRDFRDASRVWTIQTQLLL